MASQTGNKVLLAKLVELIEESHSDLMSRITSFRKIDEMLRPTIETDNRGVNKVNLPIAFPMYDTICAELCNILISDPVIKYEGVSPEDAAGVGLLEKVVAFQCKKNGIALSLGSLISYAVRYNSCAGLVSWRRSLDNTGNVAFEGSYLAPIDPYRTLYDPSVPIHRFQDANYIGWVETISIAKFLDLIKSGYFDTFKEIESVINSPESYRYDTVRGSRRINGSSTRALDVITLYVNVIPKAFGLGDSLMPEKWLFCLLGNHQIIKAVPLGMQHNKYPLVVLAPDYDDFDSTAPSRMGRLSGLQTLIDWLFSTHIKSTTRATANRIVVDPLGVDLLDVMENDTFIRVRPSAAGRDLRSLVQQLNITDVTANYYQDIGQTIAVMENISGIDGTQSGQLRKGGPERLTSSEFAGTLQAAQGRIGKMAQNIAYQLFPDLGMFFAYNTQNLMTKPVMVKIAGRWEQELSQMYKNSGGSVLAQAQSLSSTYDVIAYEGSHKNETSAGTLLEILKLVSANGVLAERFDVECIFKHLLVALGIKDVESFLRVPMENPQTQMLGQEQGQPEQPPVQSQENRFFNMAEMMNGGGY